mgnify:CR=1 FL=1
MATKRIDYIDAIKGFSVLWVVLYHFDLTGVAVLLKNDGVLPISADKKIALLYDYLFFLGIRIVFQTTELF